jgi:hypothetical protein
MRVCSVERRAQSRARLQCEEGDLVPSKADPADIPTRVSRRGEMPDTAEWEVMKLPPSEEIEGDRGRYRRMDPAGARQGGRDILDR